MSRQVPWRRGLVITAPPATEEIGAVGREIESYHGIGQGYQMVYFQTKNPNLGTFWSVLQRMLEVNFIAIWNILWTFGIIFPALVCERCFLFCHLFEIKKNILCHACI
jgi:hypothetical protein